MNFFSIPLVATAISIIICWALFAILCSLLHEAVAQIKAERGRFMKKYLLQQLQDFPNGVNWASLIYQHGTIDLLSRAPNKPTNDITSSLFAETLVDVVGKVHLVQMNLAPGQNRYQQPSLYNFKAATELLKPSDVVSFFKQAMTSAELNAPDGNGTIYESEVYKNLIQNIEKWYCEFQERLTLWYKKKTRQRLFLLGFLLGLLLNIDSIQLFNIFNKDTTARNQVMSFYQQHADDLNRVANRVTVNVPVDSTTQSLDSLLRQTKAYATQMDSLSKAAALPVGVQYSVLRSQNRPSVGLALLKILGALISGLAASFGAPFWFDLLRKAYSKNV